jgi:serine/threonine-protein kinase
MAPEQARGESSTPATDRYALACVAFELLTGRRPFARETVAAEAAAHAYEPPPPVGDLATLPAALDEVFARGLAKRPSDRPPTCAALVADLREALAGGGTRTIPVALPTRPTQPRIVRHRSGRSRAALLGGAAVLLASGVALAWALTSLGGDSGTATVVVTQTSQGRTIERTVTESNTVVVTDTADDTIEGDAGSAPAGQSGEELNDRGFRLLQQGNPESAVPVLESAVARLQGSSSLAEAYASYNLAVARFAVGRCDGVAELLDRSEQVQGKRKEIDRLRKDVDRGCRAEDED